MSVAPTYAVKYFGPDCVIIIIISFSPQSEVTPGIEEAFLLRSPEAGETLQSSYVFRIRICFSYTYSDLVSSAQWLGSHLALVLI